MAKSNREWQASGDNAEPCMMCQWNEVSDVITSLVCLLRLRVFFCLLLPEDL